MQLKHVHETQPSRPIEVTPEPFDQHSEIIQRVQGGPLKPVNLELLPRWLQLFGSVFAGCLLLMGAIALYLNFVG
ncbi:hypothetical protein CIG75_03785 [Tumebacillus algifaecis]|uniref:Uncharacterized protein n=1 Tax=Tumebacillus algifaecis TaxID=1214604 RepID=A0A223CY01_9BACL|nr:hypothetical protein [Tumebacillus algifaecis]ASS74191.1 hypothetical protein CIG75_03785 [Tumebacillus algifaecis]